METFEQQEQRARQRVRGKALIKAALIAGTITFFLPGGPWMSYESGIATMGRVITNTVWIAAVSQLVLSLLYGAAIASLIYSLPLVVGIVSGALLGLPLYGLNYIFLRSSLGASGNEVHAAIAHLMFCLLFSAMYRAMAVPPPREIAH
jgi:hypothetical protein